MERQQARRRERWSRLKGVFLFSLTAFLALSLYSHSPQDPSLNSFTLHASVANYCGYAGAFLSDLLYQIFGLAGWLFAPAGLFLSLALLRGRERRLLSAGFLAFFCFLISGSSLLALYFPKPLFFGETVGWGGGLSALLLKGMAPLFHTAGTSIVLFSLLALSALFSSPRPWLAAGALFHKGVYQGLARLFSTLRAALSGLPRRLGRALRPLSFFRRLPGFKEKSLKEAQPPPAEGLSPAPEEGESKGSAAEREPPPDARFEAGARPPAPPAFSALREAGPAAEEGAATVQLERPAKEARRFSRKDLPSLDLLSAPQGVSQKPDRAEIESLSRKLTDKLAQFAIKGKITAVKAGPAVLFFEFKPEDNVKVRKIREMGSDLSLALSAESVRIIAPIPGRDVVGVEASRPRREKVYLKNMLREPDFFKAPLPLALGRRADGAIGIKDLSRIPHLLIAGTTGSGKSVFVISFLTGLLFRHTPEALRLILIDPKRVDLSVFKDVPHLLSPIITASSKAAGALAWAVSEMEKRYRSLARFGARDRSSFNAIAARLSAAEREEHEARNQEIPAGESYYFRPLPFLCLVIEEFGDLMADPQIRKPIEMAVVRLAQKARAGGIHLILAMQSPRKDVVTGLIKTNIPGRISFKVASGVDSRVILDETGAERLLSHGDMLFLEPGTSKPARYHGPFVSEKEAEAVAAGWRALGEPCYEAAFLGKAGPPSDFPLDFAGNPAEETGAADPMYDEIVSYIRGCEAVSASFLQRKFRIGYPRAARMIEALYDEGLVGPPQGSRPREVLIEKQPPPG